MSVELTPGEKLIVEKIDFVVEQMRRGNIFAMSDLDGTRIRTSLPAIDTFNQRHGTRYTERNMRTTWDMVTWAEKLGIKNPRQYAIDLWNSYDVMRWARPVGGAIDLARFLYTHHESKIEMLAITARPSSTKKATSEWHDQWMPWANPENLIMQSEGSVNPEFKVMRLAEYEPDYYFEDQVSDAEDIVKATEKTVVIVVSQPWNEAYLVPEEYQGRIIKAEYRPWQSKMLGAFYTMVEHVTG